MAFGESSQGLQARLVGIKPIGRGGKVLVPVSDLSLGGALF